MQLSIINYQLSMFECPARVGRLPEGYDAGRQVFVGIWQEGQPIAVLELLPGLNGGEVVYLSELIVHRDARRQGHGGKIVEAVVEFARNEGFGEIQLGVGDENPDGLRFWEYCGFVLVHKYDDMSLMKRVLYEKAAD
ncbi:MAG: GNAT family N-acetyltransferase [Clostridiales bacterium]|jgi:GNAT superfamily N-acetyltransferase|nr:GNAT family N-acetyltransferase [Clostridiales bacterium]